MSAVTTLPTRSTDRTTGSLFIYRYNGLFAHPLITSLYVRPDSSIKAASSSDRSSAQTDHAYEPESTDGSARPLRDATIGTVRSIRGEISSIEDQAVKDDLHNKVFAESPAVAVHSRIGPALGACKRALTHA